MPEYPVMGSQRQRPTRFFKYLGPGGAKAVLSSMQVRLASPLTFNDPFDLQIDLRMDFSHDEFKRAFVDRLLESAFSGEAPELDASRAVFPSIEETRRVAQANPGSEDALRRAAEAAVDQRRTHFEEVLERRNRDWHAWLSTIRVFCVSEIHDSLLMWSHYCDSHKGAVLAMEGDRERDTFLLAAQPVLYQDELPALMDLENWVRRATAQAPDSVFTHYILTKSSCWAYEYEWRSFLPSDDSGLRCLYVPVEPQEIPAVYIGCRCSQSDREEILNAVSRHLPDSVVFQARKSSSRFALEFDRL